ncbi:hypothetical protein CAEBREN_07619 [Caenorhabditis brenneri]|uniref:Uncharacterized protein n=1 Tax=Caenorhabditis brenneri TaxID=135651 RepID=G0PIY4_CAEBE|nr:hypothetical protein CAEBREN_07619 [Caenorhabditis brenneri]
MTCLQKRVDFESNPEKYVPDGETWIVELAKCIFSVDQSGTPNYKRLQEILKNAETNFDPKQKRLHVSDNEGKECLF